MLTKLLLLVFFGVLFALPAFNQQTRTVYKFDVKENIPSYSSLKERLDYISSKTVREYRQSIKAGDETRAEALLKEIAKDLTTVYFLSEYSHDEFMESGWTDKQYQKLPQLQKKMKEIYRQLEKIQKEMKGTTHAGPCFLF